MIQIEHLCKEYTVKKQIIKALDDVSLTVEDGEIFGVIGLSGAGKSTLVRCINMLERPTSGRVLIDGRDVGALPKKELLKLRQSIGMIFQSFNLLEQRTVLKNVCFPLEIAGVGREAAKARALELLELVGLQDRRDSYPSQLSGGQKQRVAIARALATRPKYLLCDEATSALDPNTTRSILELLKTINRELGVTIVVITHEMRVIDRICDRVAVIDSSRVAEIGAVSRVFADPQSAIARELILTGGAGALRTGGKRIRIVFDGANSGRPVISELVLAAQAPVNILFADMKNLDGVDYGHMIVELPEDRRQEEKILAWLDSNRIPYSKEV